MFSNSLVAFSNARVSGNIRCMEIVQNCSNDLIALCWDAQSCYTCKDDIDQSVLDSIIRIVRYRLFVDILVKRVFPVCIFYRDNILTNQCRGFCKVVICMRGFLLNEGRCLCFGISPCSSFRSLNGIFVELIPAV